MSISNEILTKTEKEILGDISKLIDEEKLKKKVLEEAKKAANQTAAQVLGQNISPTPEIPKIDIEGDERDEYLLILEYLQSLGLNITPTVLRFESQHPEINVDRKKLAEQFDLPTYDKTPLLVQLIEQRLRLIEQKNKKNK